MKKVYYYFLLLIISFFIQHIFCTKNPLFEDDTIKSGVSEISGSVELSDGTVPSDVYVWLEGFDLNTKTDQDGNFEITIPKPSAQPGGGLDGSFNLYFFVANYRINSVELIVRDGRLMTSEGDLNDKGKITDTIKLIKLLNIKTTADPKIITSSFQGNVGVTIDLFAPNDPVIIKFPKTIGNKLGTALFQGSDNSIFPIDYKGNGEIYASIKDSVRTWNLTLDIVPNYLPIGEYEIIPYILVLQDNVPEELIQSLGDDVEDFGENYLKIPFKRTGGEFKVNPTG